MDAPAWKALTIPCLLAAAASGAPLAAQQAAPGDARPCPDGRISYVFIDNHSVFDTSEETENRSLRWAYRAANALHVRTRESFISGELLFREGDCLDLFRLRESARILRSYRFLASADVYAVPQPDGTNHVVVDTWDEWTTKLNISFSISEGFELRRAELTEENFLGRGLLLGAFYRERRELQEKGLQVATPRLLGSRWDAGVSVGRTRVGDFVAQDLSYPFLGEIGQIAARQQVLYRENLFAYSVTGNPDFDNVLLPFTESRIELTAARRCCEPRRYTMFGIGVTYEGLTFPGYPDNVQVTPDGDFDNPAPADSAAIANVAPQAVERETTRLNLVMGRRQIAYAQRRRLDAINGVQDVPFGWEILGTSGLSLPFLSPGGATAAPRDLFLAGFLFYGDSPSEHLVFNAQAEMEGRYLFEQGDGLSGWRDVIGEVDLYLYLRPHADSRHTLLTRLVAAVGWDMAMPFQLTLGGEDMLRGYHESDFPGGRRLALSVEDRIRLPSPFADLIDLGGTLFADAGRMWGGGVPYGANSSWRANVGAGFRVAFPPGSRHVIRFDLAFPVGNGAGARGPIFRVTADELFGLINGIEDRQLFRSRRSGITAGLFDSPVR